MHSPATIACFGLAFVAVSLYALYQWLLPKPLPGIPYNIEATKSLFGDAPAMSREISIIKEFSKWLANQVEKQGSPVFQVFVRPFSKPWILVADSEEARDILMRRPEFDKPQFLIDGMQVLGDFNARYKTNNAFRDKRHLRQDLMTPSFLHNIIGPFIHYEGLKLVKLFEAKMDLVNGRPFSVRSDFYHAALDVMAHYAFGKNLTDSGIDPQLEIISKMELSEIPEGNIDDPVDLPEAAINPFFVAIHDLSVVVEETTLSWTPKLSFWWWRHQAWYRKIIIQKDQVVSQQVGKAIDNFNAGEVKTALEHILMRENAVAKKQGREPQFTSRSIADEVSLNLC